METTTEKASNLSEYTSKKLKELQNLSLDDKIALTLTRIIEFNKRFPHKTYILII